MNGDVKVLDQNPVSPISGSAVQSQIGSLNKEAQPVTGLPELKPAGTEVSHNLDQEIKDVGVEEKKDRPDLTEAIDIQHSGPSIPVSTVSSTSIQYPMSEQEIENKLKTGPSDDSGKWLAGLIKKIMKALGV